MNKISLTLLSFLIFLSCSTGTYEIPVNDNQVEIIDVDIKKPNFIHIDSIFDMDKFAYIRLETTDDALIGANLTNYIVADSFIVISDNWVAHSLFVFNIDGTFRCKVSNYGQGPGEYIDMRHVTLDNDGNIIVLDRAQHRLMTFSSVDGSFISSWKLWESTFPYAEIEYLPSGNIAVNTWLGEFNKTQSSLHLTTPDHQQIYGSVNYSFTAMGQMRRFEKYSNGVLYFTPYTGMVYEVSDTAALLKYEIKIRGGLPIPDENVTLDEFDQQLKEYPYFRGVLEELKNVSYINIATYSQGDPFVVYSHRQKKVLFPDGISSHPFGNLCVTMDPVSSFGDNAVVFAIFPYLVNNREIKENLYRDYPKYKDFFDEFYKGMDDEENPTLFIYTLRDNL